MGRNTESPDLGSGLAAVPFCEQHIVGLAAVEGRVQVHQVHGLIRNMLPEDFEVVTTEEEVVGHEITASSIQVHRAH